MQRQMRTIEDFETIMLHLADEEGWTFRDGDDEVAPEGVFNSETFAPALMRVAEMELAARGLPIDLGVAFEQREDTLLGVSLAFDDKASLLAAMWRLSLAAYVVDQLPRIGQSRDLALLRQVFANQPALRA